MIRMETRVFTQAEWHMVVSQFDDSNIMQLWEYGEAKRKLQGWQVVRHVFRDGDTIVGAAQAMVKTIPFLKKGIVWINRAPLWQRRNHIPDRHTLQEMLEALKSYWLDQKGMYLRLAPPLMDSPENIVFMREIGFRQISSSRWISALVDLRESEDKLMAQLRREWRRDLKRAQEAGVIFKVETSNTALAEFMEDHRDFLQRKHFFTNITPEFIQIFQNLLPTGRKMPIVLAYKGTERLGSLFVATYGTVAEALGEGIRGDTLYMNAGKILFWHTITEMKKRGFSFFDVGGMHPSKTEPGVLQFKAGIRGVKYSLVGEFEKTRGLISHLLRLIIKYRGAYL